MSVKLPSCEVCGKPVDQNEPHVRAGVVHHFANGHMADAKMWHTQCWQPGHPVWDPTQDLPKEYR